MPRFFVDQPLEGQVFLGGEDGRHLAKSLRVRPGEEVTLCDGRGADALCKVLSIQGEGALLQVEKTSPSQGEPQTKVTVCQCLCKGDKLETVTQKAVELGAVEIWPLESARCVVKVDGKSAPKKVARLQKIAREAAMQSGRGVIPQVLAPASLKQALEEAARQLRARQASGESRFWPDWERRLASSFDPERFFLTEEGPSVFFPLYALGPYVEGIPTFPLRLPAQEEAPVPAQF